jgi:uncharacterized protein (DUF302 family)
MPGITPHPPKPDRTWTPHCTEPAGAPEQRSQAAKAKQTETGESRSETDVSYALSTTTPLGFADAVARVREELASEGFGVLCEIDVQATLKQKLGVDRDPYLILGACNPQLAHGALHEPELGVLLPCNVVLNTQDAQTHIAADNAEQMLSIVANDAVTDIAAEVRRRLASVIERAASA